MKKFVNLFAGSLLLSLAILTPISSEAQSQQLLKMVAENYNCSYQVYSMGEGTVALATQILVLPACNNKTPTMCLGEIHCVKKPDSKAYAVDEMDLDVTCKVGEDILSCPENPMDCLADENTRTVQRSYKIGPAQEGVRPTKKAPGFR